MQEIVSIPVQDVVPSLRAVLEAQGIPHQKQTDGRTKDLAEAALSIYKEKAAPAGIIREVSLDEFGRVFDGVGLNNDDSPVKPIFMASEHLALYAVTLGESICAEITKLFAERDFALGSMLDSAASEGAERTAEAVEKTYQALLRNAQALDSGRGILRFSPGYCGWHISAQKRLFETLRPDRIGLALNESYLMKPIKSMSGVIISGEKEIFDFTDNFTFCQECTTHECRERILAVRNQ